MNLSEAYREAYNSTGNNHSVNQSASRLFNKADIRYRVDVLFKEQSDKMMRDSVAIRRHVFTGLLKESNNKDAKPSERINALVALGKIDLVGMFRELHGIERTDDRSPEQIERELNTKLGIYLEHAPTKDK